MSKKRSIISYEKLNIEQKKQLLMAFPDGFAGSMTKMTNPITGEIYDSLLWETEEIIYLVKLPKQTVKSPSVEDDEDDFEEEEDFDKFDGKGDEEDDSTNDDEEDTYGDDPADAVADEEED
ncbi:MAG: hypothetical protein A3D31_15615 [Candidatus Fluviicola riflensis]|nr:MAG: hypothetical protein CHH17_00550 [Candidatus Fluviicola riflensis]OGS78387.1 MAG: hypothetical protein A3D31_15615 [Candidatus Fluviicola riflensis]OGS85453.1 MAG: hypothetical protein A2724_12550 [Fluviicola sp. RIFCSPHIGHO2_01_FULL_43_53]OGS87495.1 MAG: hypothetical protein A3E30_08970 [Fluviicola sp. RIFCSPHIGHO2_12_FULL_43_24]